MDDGSEATLDPTNMSYVNGEQPDVVQNSSENDVEATMRERCDAIFERDNQNDVVEATLRERCDEIFDRNNPDDDHFDDDGICLTRSGLVNSNAVNEDREERDIHDIKTLRAGHEVEPVNTYTNCRYWTDSMAMVIPIW